MANELPHGKLSATQILRGIRLSAKYPGGLVSHLRPRSSLPGIAVPFARFAQTPFERLAASYWKPIELHRFSTVQDFHQQEFLFRCLYLPLYAALQIAIIGRTVQKQEELWLSKPTSLWLFEPASYLIAWERMHLCMVLSRTHKAVNEYNGIRWNEPRRVEDIDKLPKPSPEWFFPLPDDIPLQLERFNKFRAAAERSFEYRMAQFNPDILTLDSPQLRRATLLATIEARCKLPRRLLGAMAEQIVATTDARRQFYKSLSLPEKPPILTDEPYIDAWVIEAGPIIYERRWKYPAITRVAHRKFRARKGKFSTVADMARSKFKTNPTEEREEISPRSMEVRFERLKQPLHPDARRGGRPPSAPDKAEGLFELMTIWIEAFPAKETAWFLGQRNLVAEVEKLAVNFV